jgi:hypothetical protein
MAKVEKSEINLKKCFCPNCPSYNECAKGKMEKLYCAGEVGKSVCEYKMNGCLCGGCPVHAENNLQAGYYCLNGSADEIEVKSKM